MRGLKIAGGLKSGGRKNGRGQPYRTYKTTSMLHLFLAGLASMLSTSTSSIIGCKALFISSFSSVIGEGFRNLVQEQLSESSVKKLVYVPTASYVFDPSSPRSKGDQRRRARYDAKQKMSYLLSELQLSDSVLLELDSPTVTSSTVKNTLKDAAVLYVDGGNTFYLQKHVRESQLWGALEERGSDCLYIGASAGAIIAGKSISTAFWKGWDDPAAATDMSWDSSTLSGAGMVGHSFFMHHDEQFESLVRDRSLDLDHTVLTVGNDQVIVRSTLGELKKFYVAGPLLTPAQL